MILYHYTSKENYDNIITGNVLNPTQPFLTQDAAYGYGWYLTDRTPDTCDAWTVAHCWQTTSTSFYDKVECYLKFDIPDWLVKKGRDHVYLIALTSWNGLLSQTTAVKYIEGGRTPGCSKKPCWLCETIHAVKKFLRLE